MFTRAVSEIPAGQDGLNLLLLVQILAPLTRGGNIPFRRLCVDFGAEATMSEMCFARMLLKGEPVERSRLRKAENEQCFGELLSDELSYIAEQTLCPVAVYLHSSRACCLQECLCILLHIRICNIF